MRTLALACAALVSAGCPQTPRPTAPATPLPVPQLDIVFFERALERGARVYQVDAEQTRLTLRVGRAGALKHLGHDHVIASESVTGFVVVGAGDDPSRAELLVPLEDFIVDDPAYRERAGLKGEVDDDAIAGTTANMRKVLATAGPAAHVVISPGGAGEFVMRVQLGGAVADVSVPAELSEDADLLHASGQLTLDHAALGLTPYSAAGGLLRVADDIDFSFELVALRVNGAGGPAFDPSGALMSEKPD